MTTIVAVCKNGNVTMGADSQVTDGARPHRHPQMQKIAKITKCKNLKVKKGFFFQDFYFYLFFIYFFYFL